MEVDSSARRPISTSSTPASGPITSVCLSSQWTIASPQSTHTRQPSTTASKSICGWPTISRRSSVPTINYVDITPEDIVLVGDSAGGNIIASLTGLLIKLKQRLPSGIVLIYPTLNLTFNSYSPSILASLDDAILPHTYLKLCLSSYLPENRRAT